MTRVHSGQRGPFMQDFGMTRPKKQWQRLLSGCEFQGSSREDSVNSAYTPCVTIPFSVIWKVGLRINICRRRRLPRVRLKMSASVMLLGQQAVAGIRLLGALGLLLVLAACQPTVFLMPTPTALSTGEIDPFASNPILEKDTRVPVLFATNRVPYGTEDSRAYTIFAADTVRLGLATLRIGDEKLDWERLHAISSSGEVEKRPALFLDNIEEWAAIDFGTGETALSPEAGRFFDAVNQALAESQDKDLMVYVHGANSSIYRATAQAAQYRHFTGRNSVVLAFAWPSAESLLHYGTDVKHAARTAPLFAEFIRLLAAHTRANNINILAYSAGAQVTSPALVMLGEGAADESPGQLRERLRLGEVYFAAPDVEFKKFAYDLHEYIDIVNNVTMAVNLNDDVLAFAQFHQGVSRAGRPDLRELDEEETQWLIEATQQSAFDIINVDPETVPNLGTGSHSFWYEHPWISSDILIQFLLHARPAERGLVANTTEKGGEFWTFPPDYDTRIIELLKQSRPGADGPPSPEPGR
jgi:esterase/lipase superfamily enzyme